MYKRTRSNKYTQAVIESEIKGRDKYLKLSSLSGIQNVTVTPIECDWDAEYYTSTPIIRPKELQHFSSNAIITKTIIEIKDRDCKITDHDCDFFLEQYKYNKLKWYLENVRNLQGYYINFFHDNYYAIWDLKNVDESRTETRRCNRTTAYYSGTKDKVMIYLHISDAIEIGCYSNSRLIKNTQVCKE